MIIWLETNIIPLKISEELSKKKLPGNLSDGRLISITYFPGYIFLSIHLVRKF